MTGPVRGNKGRIGDLPEQIANSTSLYHERIVIPNGSAIRRRNEESQIDVAGFRLKKKEANLFILYTINDSRLSLYFLILFCLKLTFLRQFCVYFLSINDSH